MAGNNSSSSPVSRRSILTAGGAALAVVLGLSGCAQEDALAQQAKAGDNKNYVAGDGSVTEFAAADRKRQTPLCGVTDAHRHIGARGAAGDSGRTAIDHRIVDSARILVFGVAAPDQLSLNSGGELLEVSHRAKRF